VFFPRKREGPAPGFTVLERTPFKYDADFNAGAFASSVYVAYKQQFRNVDQLRNEPGTASPRPTSSDNNATAGGYQ
jgi:hypothetical protein